MKKLFMFIIGLMMVFSFSSCVGYTYATTQDDIYVEAETDVVRSNVDFNIVIRYGTPYYYEGSLLYYLYEGLYYYPFYYDNYWYVRAYRRPFAHLHHRPYFRPHRYDYRFRPDHHPGFGHNGHINGRPHRPGVRPDNRPSHRPDVRPWKRPNNRPDVRPGNRPGNRPNGGMNPRPNRRPDNVSPRPRPDRGIRHTPSVGRPSVPSRSGGGGHFGGGNHGRR